MYYHHGSGQAIATSVPRALFAAGVPEELDETALIRNLLHDHTDQEHGWYRGVRQVALGSIVHLPRNGDVRCVRWYDLNAIPVRQCRDEEAVEGALALLREAGQKVVAGSARPGQMLSGGLDSPLAALALLEALPAEQRLPTFTFVPSAKWDGKLNRALYGDERPLVEELARMYPRLDPHFAAGEDASFDYRFKDMFLAMGVAPAALPTFFAFHALWQQARESGCDRLICSDLGNLSYSQSGLWAPAEYFRRLRWGQLGHALKPGPGDPRSFPHRFLSRAVMPHLSLAGRRRIRRMIKGAQPRRLALTSAIDRTLLENWNSRLDANPYAASFEGFSPRDRREGVLPWTIVGDGGLGDIRQGFEQLYGIPQRDIAAYRPLVEFCLSLPTEQFNKDGVSRRLARRMGAGRLPGTIVGNSRLGQWGVDWHARMTPRREEWLGELRRAKGDPQKSHLLDLDRMIAVLEDWPETTVYDPDVYEPRRGAIPRALLTSRFVDFVSGRNSS